MGIWWSSWSNEFNIALSNLNLKSKNNSQIKWHFQTTSINSFKQSCQLDELKRFEESLLLIPNQVVFDMYAIILKEKLLAKTKAITKEFITTGIEIVSTAYSFFIGSYY
jgi:hypothetical protein